MSKSDRQAGAIEITQEMIEAGEAIFIDALYEKSPDWLDSSDGEKLVSAIYRAMILARNGGQQVTESS